MGGADNASHEFVTQLNHAPYWRSGPHAGWDMAKKRTKADKAQRQADGLEKKLERRPAQVPEEKAPESKPGRRPRNL